MVPITVERDVLGRHAGGQVALDRHRHRLGPHLRQRLGGEDVLHLAGADAEHDRAEGPVGGGVAVAADDGHARLGPALLGPDDVDDALVGVAHGVAGDAELGRVVVEHLELLGRDRVGDRLVDVGGGDVVVRRRHREIGAPHGAPGQAQPVEGLRRGHLVHQVQVDEQQVGLGFGRMDDVRVPDLLAERAWRHQRVTSTMWTLSTPPGAWYSTASPALRPTSTWPSGELGETTGRSPWRSSMEPTKNVWVSSSSSPS